MAATSDWTAKKGIISAVVAVVLGVLCCVGGPICIDYGLFGQVESRIWTTSIGTVVLLLGPVFVYSGFVNSGLRVALFEHGFVHVRGGKVSVVRWDQIESVWQKIVDHYSNGVKTGTTHTFTLKRYDEDATMVLDDTVADIKNPQPARVPGPGRQRSRRELIVKTEELRTSDWQARALLARIGFALSSVLSTAGQRIARSRIHFVL